MDRYLMSQYNPLTVGNSWEYLNNGKSTISHKVVEEVSLNGIAMEKVISSDGSVVLLKNRDGLDTYEIKKKVGKLSYSPPISLSPEIVKPGVAHAYVSKVTFSLFGINFNFGNISGSTVLTGVEDVTVPAGHFPDCLKFESYAYQRKPLKATSKLIIWFARNVGEVKCEFETSVAGFKTTQRKELLHATIGKRHFPEVLAESRY
ncbi:hypothetical protein SAMN05428949_0090 [Chitinophaga sp. YR627]|uniref:Uncharacterized protein elaH n=1 Tax=Chitinophaga sancti TaxID=1004 RepID=F5B9C8_9BACT|nr:hypothetical protein [Chitinophaga sp. YR627]AEC04354.1 hypothetical protein [Chitinophaga sancti]SFM59046.1 hypothetical protein SAMN05428949_0090 [Chitinophaga sp. YR627]